MLDQLSPHPSLVDLAAISQQSYSEVPNTRSVGTYTPINQAFDTNFWSHGTGFTSHAYFSNTENTLVVSFAGTVPGIDLLTDAQLAVVGRSNQDNLALNFASTTIDQLNSQGIRDFNVVYTGHSLGGYLSQVAATQNSNASVVVFNSPGTGGLLWSGPINLHLCS